MNPDHDKPVQQQEQKEEKVKTIIKVEENVTKTEQVKKTDVV